MRTEGLAWAALLLLALWCLPGAPWILALAVLWSALSPRRA